MSCERAEPDSSTESDCLLAQTPPVTPRSVKSSSPRLLHKVDNPKIKHRRVKANARERNRMHGLNHALEELRKHIPLVSYQHQRLSKIETLRLARNYIAVLTQSLQTEGVPSNMDCAKTLAAGMSQTTANLIASTFQVHPRVLMHENQPTCSTSMHAGNLFSYATSPDSESVYSDNLDFQDIQNPALPSQSAIALQQAPVYQSNIHNNAANHGAPYEEPTTNANAFVASAEFYPLPYNQPQPAFQHGYYTEGY